MNKFRKKPVVIEAVQFTRNGTPGELAPEEICQLINGGVTHPIKAWVNGHAIYIQTLEGVHRAEVGDWIIKGVAGEFYPCKPEIFSLTYETFQEVH